MIGELRLCKCGGMPYEFTDNDNDGTWHGYRCPDCRKESDDVWLDAESAALDWNDKMKRVNKTV